MQDKYSFEKGNEDKYFETIGLILIVISPLLCCLTAVVIFYRSSVPKSHMIPMLFLMFLLCNMLAALIGVPLINYFGNKRKKNNTYKFRYYEHLN